MARAPRTRGPQVRAAIAYDFDGRLRDEATKLSDRDRQSLESEVETHEGRINEAVYTLYGVDAPSSEPHA